MPGAKNVILNFILFSFGVEMIEIGQEKVV